MGGKQSRDREYKREKILRGKTKEKKENLMELFNVTIVLMMSNFHKNAERSQLAIHAVPLKLNI